MSKEQEERPVYTSMYKRDYYVNSGEEEGEEGEGAGRETEIKLTKKVGNFEAC